MDVRSGCYSHEDSHKLDDMVGYFQVLRGLPGGGFAKAEIVSGDNDEPLAMRLDDPSGEDYFGGDRFCTATFAVDLDEAAEKKLAEWDAGMAELNREKAVFVDERDTGFVWLLIQQ